METQNTECWKPSVTADVVVVDIHQAKFRADGAFINILLMEKSKDRPGCWALPGGLLTKGETIEHCAVRELFEKTGVMAKNLQPIVVNSMPDRDPSGQVISHSFLTIIPTTDEEPLVTKSGSNAKQCELFRLKGKFSKEDGSLEVTLSNKVLAETIEFKAEFKRADLGLLITHITNKSMSTLALDHAEIIARAILRVPDLVMHTSEKPTVEGEEK